MLLWDVISEHVPSGVTILLLLLRGVISEHVSALLRRIRFY